MQALDVRSAPERACGPSSRTRRPSATPARRRSARPSAPAPTRREAIAEMQAVSARVKELEPEVARLEAELDELNASLPNPPDPTAADEDTPLREWGEFRAEGKDHLELAGAMIDMEAGSKVSGPRFAFLKGDLVFLELALVRWVLEVLRGHGFEPVIPPVLVKEQALFGTGFLPDTEQQIYRLADDPLYLTGHFRGAAGVAARGRDHGVAARPLRRVLALLPARGGRRGQGHARASSACTSSTRSRCSRSSSAGVRGRGARAAAGDRGGDPPGPRDPVPGREHRRRRPRLAARPRSTTSRPGCRRSSASAS